MTDREARVRAAVHEAGHCAGVALVGGASVERVTLEGDGGLTVLSGFDPEDRGARRAAVLIALGGLAAERAIEAC